VGSLMTRVQLKVKKVHPLAQLPSYAYEMDAGLDLFAVEEVEIPPGIAKRVPIGIRLELPPNTEAQVRPRSGLALKHQVTVLNSPGTIDWGYRGDLYVVLINHGQTTFRVTVGARIAQLVIAPVLQVDLIESEELSETERGDGFGSSGS
jgi:dUTP pyrophosphatase